MLLFLLCLIAIKIVLLIVSSGKNELQAPSYNNCCAARGLKGFILRYTTPGFMPLEFYHASSGSTSSSAARRLVFFTVFFCYLLLILYSSLGRVFDRGSGSDCCFEEETGDHAVPVPRTHHINKAHVKMNTVS